MVLPKSDATDNLTFWIDPPEPWNDRMESIEVRSFRGFICLLESIWWFKWHFYLNNWVVVFFKGIPHGFQVEIIKFPTVTLRIPNQCEQHPIEQKWIENKIICCDVDGWENTSKASGTTDQISAAKKHTHRQNRKTITFIATIILRSKKNGELCVLYILHGSDDNIFLKICVH